MKKRAKNFGQDEKPQVVTVALDLRKVKAAANLRIVGEDGHEFCYGKARLRDLRWTGGAGRTVSA